MRKQNAKKKIASLYKGFTLIEVLVSTILIALLATFFYAPGVLSKLQDFRRHQADVVAEELNRVGVAAQKWAIDNSGDEVPWPGGNTRCASLFDVLSQDLAQFRGARNPRTPFHQSGFKRLPLSSTQVRSVELGRYYPSCNAEQLRVDVFFDTDDSRWGNYIANRLAGAVVDNLGSTYDNVTRLSSLWPLPAIVGLGENYVRKDAPEFEGGLQSNIDLDGHAIYGASDVVLGNGHSLGKTMVFAGVVRPPATIVKPDCAPGLSPQILASFNTIYHGTGRPMHYAQVYTEEVELAPKPAWRVRTRVTTYPNLISNDSPGIRVNVFVRCS